MESRPHIPDEHDPRLRQVCETHGVRMVILYGSHATNKPPPTADSDLDLAASIPEVGLRDFYREIYPALSEVFSGYSLDLVQLHHADPLFRYEIMRAGRLLYGDIDGFLEYKAFAYRDFVDSADLRTLEDALFRKKMASIRESLYAAA